jgi:hypothetical protein
LDPEALAVFRAARLPAIIAATRPDVAMLKPIPLCDNCKSSSAPRHGPVMSTTINLRSGLANESATIGTAEEVASTFRLQALREYVACFAFMRASAMSTISGLLSSPA